MEKSVSNGTKVPEVQITTLTEMLMRQAIKLENISSEATDVSTQKNLQVFIYTRFFAIFFFSIFILFMPSIYNE